MSDPLRRLALRTEAVLILALAAGLAGCSDAVPLIDEFPHPPLPDMLRVEKPLDRPANVIERGLSHCPKRVEAGETECLKKALLDEHVGASQLIALMSGCRLGQICHYDYTTVDQVGFVPATASRFVVDWRAAFDLRKRPADVAGIPISVVQH